jgi:hypothetical protein
MYTLKWHCSCRLYVDANPASLSNHRMRVKLLAELLTDLISKGPTGQMVKFECNKHYEQRV